MPPVNEVISPAEDILIKRAELGEEFHVGWWKGGPGSVVIRLLTGVTGWN